MAAARLIPRRMRALVLNADYVPISTTTAWRGHTLCLHKRAVAVEMSDFTLRSETLELELPSVIVLTAYQQITRRTKLPPRPSRHHIFERDRSLCQYCGEPATTLDHIVPRSRGGQTTWENVVCCCSACNRKKGAKLLENTALRLRSQPSSEAPAWSAYQPRTPGRPLGVAKSATARATPARVGEVWRKYLRQEES